MQPFTKVESFTTYGRILDQVSSLTDMNSKFLDICGNLANYNATKARLVAYKDFNGTNTDGTTYLEYQDKSSTVKEAVKEDIEQMIIQQNNVYIIGMITVTTILISLYLILKK
jgi:hypothetical protein